MNYNEGMIKMQNKKRGGIMRKEQSIEMAYLPLDYLFSKENFCLCPMSGYGCPSEKDGMCTMSSTDICPVEVRVE